MDLTKEIKKILIDEGITQTELAERLNTSSGNLTNKLRRNDMKVSDLSSILDKLGYRIEFIKVTN